MMAFAQASDLEARLKTTFDDPTAAQVTALLEDASDHLRWSVIGQQVYPPVDTTFDVWVYPGDRWIPLTLTPISDVTVTDADSATLPSDLIDNRIRLHHPIRPISGWPANPVKLTVAGTVGMRTPPGDLASWCMVLANGVMQNIDEFGTIGNGGVTSLAIDDYRKGWSASADGSTEFSVPPAVQARLRARFGGGAYVLEAQR